MSYIVKPKKEPRLMTEKENLEWELACQQEYLKTCSEKRKSGHMGRILEIQRIFQEWEQVEAEKKEQAKILAMRLESTKVNPVISSAIQETMKPVEMPSTKLFTGAKAPEEETKKTPEIIKDTSKASEENKDTAKTIIDSAKEAIENIPSEKKVHKKTSKPKVLDVSEV